MNIPKNFAVIGGKTKSSEFAVHKETDVVNPHYHGRTSGTSSSGSAAVWQMVQFAYHLLLKQLVL